MLSIINAEFIAKYGPLLQVPETIRVFLYSQRTATFAASEELSHQQLNKMVKSNSRL